MSASLNMFILINEAMPVGTANSLRAWVDGLSACAAFYPKKSRDGSTRPGSHQHLAEEFERRLTALQKAGVVPDARDAQIARLKDANTDLAQRLRDREQQLKELAAFKQLALSRIAAQHLEIGRLRTRLPEPAPVAVRGALRVLPGAPDGPVNGRP